MGDDSPFDLEGYQKSIDSMGIPASFLSKDPYRPLDPDIQFRKPSLLQSLKYIKEAKEKHIKDLETAISILEKNPDIEKFLDVFDKIK